MKISKLSLAAIVAVGALTTVANAGALEEAVKGVEIDGYTRYRADKVTDKSVDHNFEAKVNVVSPVAENLKAGVTVKASGTDKTEAKDGIAVGMDALWFQYSANNISVKAGKFGIDTPWTDGEVGDGALALYSGVPGWTFAAAGFLLNNTFDGLTKGDSNIYALAALGKVGPVGLQVWGSHMDDVFDYSFFGDATFEMAGLSVELQANYLKVAEELYGKVAHDAGVFFGGKLGYARNGFSGTVGFTQNDKDQPIHSLGGASGFIKSGAKQSDGDAINQPEGQLMFVDLGYELNKFDVGAGYTMVKVGGEDASKEWYVSGGYSYSKNFKLSGYFSSKDVEGADDNTNKLRFEAKYSF